MKSELCGVDAMTSEKQEQGENPHNLGFYDKYISVIVENWTRVRDRRKPALYQLSY